VSEIVGESFFDIPVEKLQRWGPGEPLDHKKLNQPVDAIERMTRGVRLPRQVNPPVVKVEAESWLGKIKNVGPASEADYTDERYWVARVYNDNELGDKTADPTFTEIIDSDDPLYRYVTATNLAENVDATHLLDTDGDQYVRVWAIYDKQDPTIRRFYFWQAVGGVDLTEDHTTVVTLVSTISAFSIVGSNLRLTYKTKQLTFSQNADNVVLNVTVGAESAGTNLDVALGSCP